jgi:hypothetical protein
MLSFNLYLFGTSLRDVPNNLRYDWHCRFHKRAYGVIDERIFPLVTAVNATGCIETYASCQGHGWSGRGPYLAFNADANIASAIEMKIRHYQLRLDCNLTHYWSVDGSFNQTGELVFKLFAPWLASSDVFSLNWLRLGLFRGPLDRDLLLLGQLVQQAVSSEVGFAMKPVGKLDGVLECG